MAQLEIIQVTREELDNGVVPVNHVLCKVHYESEGMQTKSGITVGILTELTYQDSDNDKDDSSHIADWAETSFIVYKVPERLWFDPDDGKSMQWETECEVQVGDLVFTNAIDALNAVTLECEKERYCFIPYEELYVAKRVHEQTVGIHYGEGNYYVGTDPWVEVIPLNGYILIEPVHYEKLSDLDVTSEDKEDKTRGKVRFIGSCNKRYRKEEDVDFADLRVGDTVLLDKKAAPFLLQRTKYNDFFSDTGEKFFVVQRRKIAMVVDRP